MSIYLLSVADGKALVDHGGHFRYEHRYDHGDDAYFRCVEEKRCNCKVALIVSVAGLNSVRGRSNAEISGKFVGAGTIAAHGGRGQGRQPGDPIHKHPPIVCCFYTLKSFKKYNKINID